MIESTIDKMYLVPTISFYLGGTGIEIGSRIENIQHQKHELFETLYIDSQLPQEEEDYHRFLHAHYRNLHDFKSGSMRDYCDQRFPDFLGKPPIFDSNGGCGITRLFGSASLVNKREEFEDMLFLAYKRIQLERRASSMPLQVFLTASTCGGTGAGMIIDAAAFVRDWFLKNKLDAPRIYLFLVAPDVFSSGHEAGGPSLQHTERMSASAYGLLKELSHYADGHDFNSSYSINRPIVQLSNSDDNQRLFDWVYWFNAHGTNGTANFPARNYAAVSQVVAEFQLHLATSVVAKDIMRIMPNQRESRYRKYALDHVHNDHKVISQTATTHLSDSASKTTFLSSASVLNVVFPFEIVKKYFSYSWLESALKKLSLGISNNSDIDNANQVKIVAGGYPGSHTESLYRRWQLDPSMASNLDFSEFLLNKTGLTSSKKSTAKNLLELLKEGNLHDEINIQELDFDEIQLSVRQTNFKLKTLLRELRDIRDGSKYSELAKEYSLFVGNRLKNNLPQFMADLREMASDAYNGIGYLPTVRALESLIRNMSAHAEKATIGRELDNSLFQQRVSDIEYVAEELSGITTRLSDTNKIAKAIRHRLSDTNLLNSVRDLDEIEDALEEAFSAYNEGLDELKNQCEAMTRNRLSSATIEVLEQLLGQHFRPEANKIHAMYLRQEQEVRFIKERLNNTERRTPNTVLFGNDARSLALLGNYLENPDAISTRITNCMLSGDIPIGASSEFFDFSSLLKWTASDLTDSLNAFVLSDQSRSLNDLSRPWRYQDLNYLLTDAAKYLDQGYYPLINYDDIGLKVPVSSWLIVPPETELPKPYGHRIANSPRIVGRDEHTFSIVSATFGVPPNALIDAADMFGQYWLHISDGEPQDTKNTSRYPLHISKEGRFYDEPFSPIDYIIEDDACLGSLRVFGNEIDVLDEKGSFQSPIRGKVNISEKIETLDWNVFIEFIHLLLDQIRLREDVRKKVHADQSLSFLADIYSRATSSSEPV